MLLITWALLVSEEKAASVSGDPANTSSGSINGNVYSNLQTFLDGLEEEDSEEGFGQQAGEKKRRLKVEQVKALEKSFEAENKLKPERKAELAQELGLQPRQVAVWFQNRRARWKSKHLEKDFALLKAGYDSLKLKHAALLQEKESILADLSQLKSNLRVEKKSDFSSSIKEETENPVAETGKKGSALLLECKPQKDESCCSVVMDGCDLDQMVTLMPSSTSSSTSCLELSDMGVLGGAHKEFYHHGLAMEGNDYISSAEESCNFFSDEQAPSLSWYSSEPWN